MREVYIPEHNKRYGIGAREAWDSHHKTDSELGRVFSRRWKRVIANDMCIQHQNRYYQLLKWEYEIRPRMSVEVRENVEWEIRLQVREKEIKYEEVWSYEVKSTRARKRNEIRKAREREQEERAKMKSDARHELSKKRQSEYRAKKIWQQQLL
jgi:hypothetical protein